MDNKKISAFELVQARLKEDTLRVDAENGAIYSRAHNGKWRKLTGSIRMGYIYHGLNWNGYHKYLAAHRIVYMVVYGEIPKGIEVDHINRLRHDNCISNLRLATTKENAANKGAPVTLNIHTAPIDIDVKRILTWQEVDVVREIYVQGAMSRADLAEKFGVSCRYITDVLSGKVWHAVMKQYSDSIRKGYSLTLEQVEEVRRLYVERPISIRQIAERFGIKEQHVYTVAYDGGVSQSGVRVGTRQDGIDNPNAKLTPEQVDAIRKEYAEGDTDKEALGAKYNITGKNVQSIVSGRTWGDNPYVADREQDTQQAELCFAGNA